MTFHRKTLMIVALVPLMFGVGVLSAEEDKPDWQDLVSGVVQEALEGSGDGQVGQIRRVKMIPRGADSVDLSVEVRGVDDPGRVAFEVVIYDDNLNPLEPLEVSWDEIPVGEGRTMLHVTYLGGGEMRTVGGNLLLVDRDTGQLSSKRKVAIPWEWKGSGGGGSSAGYGPAPAADSLSTRSDDGGTPAREPVIVELRPVRVGDTPKPEEIRLSTAQTVRVADAPTPKPTRRPRKPAPRPTSRPAPRPTPRTNQVAGIASVAASGIHLASTTVDLYALASKAKWSSSRGALPFNGSNNDNRGFVRALGTASMLDGKKYSKVLQTHPTWTDNGTISGAFTGTIPASASQFTARGGFLKGVTRSNGVRVTVQIQKGNRRVTIVERTIAARPAMVTINGPIPKEFRGQRATLTLTVHANGKSTQDWFAWIAPVVK
jgi:hypothetical protein